MTATLVWFRLDLRLDDHEALNAALALGPVIPVFIWAPEEEAPWPPGAASRAWLHRSLSALSDALANRGSRLILRRGPTGPTLEELLRETKAKRVFWHRRYEPALIARDAQIKDRLTRLGVEARSFNGSLLFEPWELKTQADSPFQVFTPFWKACVRRDVRPPATFPKARWVSPERWPVSEAIGDWSLRPAIAWDKGFDEHWTPGEAGARTALDSFVGSALVDYPEHRNFPDRVGTSRLSPHLHFGEISPRQIWDAVQRAAAASGRSGAIRAAEGYLREIGWREFAYHLLYHFPHTTDAPLRPEFQAMVWRREAAEFVRWQRGRTGYALVDAGMRELWATGWMHNRVRMVAASFLVKDLLISWQEGARWFWDTLVDADLANNTLGWQWVAGCGADAAPYYRIFNPELQSQKFDPAGRYRAAWATRDAIAPMVDHDSARQRALAAFESLPKRRQAPPP